MGRHIHHIEGMGCLPMVGLGIVSLAEEGELDHLGNLSTSQIDGAAAVVGVGMHHIEMKQELAEHGQRNPTSLNGCNGLRESDSVMITAEIRGQDHP
jgi:hypothetical protein